jgi:hypothetical protein
MTVKAGTVALMTLKLISKYQSGVHEVLLEGTCLQMHKPTLILRQGWLELYIKFLSYGNPIGIS